MNRCGSEVQRLQNELVGREALEGLQGTAKAVGGDELSEVASKLIVVVVVEALDRRVLNGAVHSLDLTVIRHDGLGALTSR